MSTIVSLQDYLSASTQKAGADLIAALLRLPEDKRNWSPADTARPAMDQVAECALNNGYTADLIQTGKWVAPGFDQYLLLRKELASQEWETLHALFKENTGRVVMAIRTFPAETLNATVETPFGQLTWSGILGYPYWNMAYHEGQINFLHQIILDLPLSPYGVSQNDSVGQG